MMISAFCFFRVANRHTFGALFGRDLTDPALRAHYRAMLGDMVVAYIRVPGNEQVVRDRQARRDQLLHHHHERQQRGCHGLLQGSHAIGFLAGWSCAAQGIRD